MFFGEKEIAFETITKKDNLNFWIKMVTFLIKENKKIRTKEKSKVPIVRNRDY